MFEWDVMPVLIIFPDPVSEMDYTEKSDLVRMPERCKGDSIIDVRICRVGEVFLSTDGKDTATIVFVAFLLFDKIWIHVSVVYRLTYY